MLIHAEDIQLNCITKSGNAVVWYKNELYLLRGRIFNKILKGIPEEVVESEIEIQGKKVKCLKTLTF